MVGESGSGKSMLALSRDGAAAERGPADTAGSVLLDGEDADRRDRRIAGARSGAATSP